MLMVMVWVWVQLQRKMLGSERHMSHDAICRSLERVKICQSGKWLCFCYVGSSCESVDSNWWLPLQYNLCMNIKDVDFGKSELFFDGHVKMVFVLTSIVLFNVWTLFNFKGIVCIYVARNMGQFASSKFKLASLLWVCTFSHEKFWRCSTIEFFPSSGTHKHSGHLPSEFDWSKVFFRG